MYRFLSHTQDMTFSSFQEFEIQYSLGTIPESVLEDIMYDDASPEEYKHLIANTCTQEKVLNVVAYWEGTTEEQLLRILSKTFPRRSYSVALDHMLDRKTIPVNVMLRIVDITDADARYWEEERVRVIHQAEEHPEILKRFLLGRDAESVEKEAAYKLWKIGALRG